MTFRECDLDRIDPRLFAVYYAIRLPDGRLHATVHREKRYPWFIFGLDDDRSASRITARSSWQRCAHRSFAPAVVFAQHVEHWVAQQQEDSDGRAV